MALLFLLNIILKEINFIAIILLLVSIKIKKKDQIFKIVQHLKEPNQYTYYVVIIVNNGNKRCDPIRNNNSEASAYNACNTDNQKVIF